MAIRGQGLIDNKYWRIGKRLARIGYRCFAKIFLYDERPILMYVRVIYDFDTTVFSMFVAGDVQGFSPTCRPKSFKFI